MINIQKSQVIPPGYLETRQVQANLDARVAELQAKDNQQQGDIDSMKLKDANIENAYKNADTALDTKITGVDNRLKTAEGMLSDTNRLTATLQQGQNVVNAVPGPMDVEISGNTLVNVSQTGLKAGSLYVTTDKKSKVRAGKNTAVQTGVSKFQVPVMTKADFSGKVAGSVVENPHDIKWSTATTLVIPSSWSAENSQSQIDRIKGLDGNIASTSVSTLGGIAQRGLSFNLIEHVERTIGLIPKATVAEKVQWLKDNLNKLTANWHGYGTSPAGNKATVARWNGTAWIVHSFVTNGTVTKIAVPDTDMANRIQADGFIHYLAYAEPSDGVTASTIYTEFVELEVELKAGTQLEKPKLIRVANFEGKVSGSTVENPHVVRWESNPSLTTPDKYQEVSNSNYANIATLNGQSFSYSTLGNRDYAQIKIAYNVIEEIERQVGQIPRATLAEKVQWVKDNVSRVNCNWHGYGTGPTGNKATLVQWFVNGNSWQTPFSHMSNSVLRIQSERSNPGIDRIDTNGFVHFLAYAEPSDGTTASTIYTKYVELEIELKPTAVLSPKLPLFEVEQADYDKILTTWTEADVQNRFPMVEGVEHVQNPVVTVEGDNLLPPFYEWTLHANAKVISPYEAELNATSSYQSSEVDIPVIAGQPYTLSKVSGNVRYWGYWLDKDKKTIDYSFGILTTSPFVTITAVANARYLRLLFDSNTSTGVFKTSQPMLTLGSTAKPFVPRNPSYLYAPVKLGKIGTAKDTLYRDGQEWKVRKEIEKDVVLDGTVSWSYVKGTGGHKQFSGIVSLPIDIVGNYRTKSIFTKYNGSVIKGGNVITETAEIFDISTTSRFELMTPNSETGFADAYTPVADEIKSYFNGWQVKTADGAGKPTAWRSVVDGADAPTQTLAYVKSNRAPRYTPYTLSYVLATPKVETVTVEGSLVLNGLSQVAVDAGVIVREKVTPQLYNGTYFINGLGSTREGNTNVLKNRPLVIYKVFKNGIEDKKWNIFNVSPSNVMIFGMQQATITTTDYDPTAEYTVTYLVLDKHLFTVNPADVKAMYAANLRTAVQDMSAQITDNSTMVTIHTAMLAEMYKRLKALGG